MAHVHVQLVVNWADAAWDDTLVNLGGGTGIYQVFDPFAVQEPFYIDEFNLVFSVKLGPRGYSDHDSFNVTLCRYKLLPSECGVPDIRPSPPPPMCRDVRPLCCAVWAYNGQCRAPTPENPNSYYDYVS